MSDNIDRRAEPRTSVQTREHQNYLMLLMMKYKRNGQQFIELMQREYPEYTAENFAYDKRRIRHFGIESLKENAEALLTKQVNVRLAMLEIAWDNYHDARGQVLRTEETRTSTSYNAKGDVSGTSESSTTKLTESTATMEYWWEQVMKIQEKIESLLGLHHINVNMNTNNNVFVKMYAVDPARNWPAPPSLSERADSGVIDGEIVE